MYPVLILRAELICLVLLIFLFFTSRSYDFGNENKSFSRIIRLAILHVIFDAITVVTVNNADVVPVFVNDLCHIIFYVSAILFSNEMVGYVSSICYPNKVKKIYSIGHILTLLYICCLPFMKIEYEPVINTGTYSSTGVAAYVGYGLALVFFIFALVIIFTHLKLMTLPIKSALIPMMLVLMITGVSQAIWKNLLFTGGAITIVTVGFFFSLENPVEVFKKKAMTDALTGVRSRSSYEEEIDKLDKVFKACPGDEHIFVFCDLNDLRSVNNQFGHAEGDNYISLIATSINTCMVNASGIYRIGGDEFLIYYHSVSEEIVEKELSDLQEACVKASENLKYSAAISSGYARSSVQYRSLRDVVKTADYAMYQNKTKMKNSMATHKSKLNYTGLTDKMFDAICASNDRSYPFVTNLDTNVTRISPKWREYFGLEDEFYEDFNSVWKDRIHPDYYEGYLEDIAAVINGHREFHNYDYLAKRADGQYVRVSCHGSVYNDKSDGRNYFIGFIINFGVEKNIEPLTGLKNFNHLTSSVCKHMDDGTPFSVIKLRLNNYARVNMLYGYDGGNEILKKLSDVLQREVNGIGEVYCEGAVNFSILFETCDKKILESCYRKITEKCSMGIETENGAVPLRISGGVIRNNGNRMKIDRIRGALVFALEESHYYRRNTLVFYDEMGDETVGNDISLLSLIHSDANASMEYFQMRYQPIVNASSRTIIGAEALLRWIHPVYGEFAPEKFISFIENDPCYYRLGLSILEQAIIDAKKIQTIISDFKINVNITALQLQNENFVDNVCSILSKHDFHAENLVLELTERCKEMNSVFLAKKISELRSRRILVAFDDFGTGHSTLNLLMDIPVDEIKLDKDFVRDIGKRKNYDLFVQALINGSSSAENGYNICFEGIENESMLSQVKCFGDFIVQGYYFAKPLLIDEFIAYINDIQNGMISC